MKKRPKQLLLGLLVGLLLNGMTAYGASETEDKIQIRFMHYWGDSDTDRSGVYMRQVLKNEFEEAFPGVELIQEVYDNQTFKTKIKVQMASDEAVDIMSGYGGGFIENFVDAGKLLPIEDYLSDFYKEHMIMDMHENFIFDDELYGICISYWNGVLYCNQALFDQAGAEIPETYEELIEVSQKFREAGIEPVACGMVNKWHGQQWINNFTIQLGGADLYNAMVSGEESMDNEVLAQAAQLTADLVEADVFCSDMYSITTTEAEDKFLNGGAAMIYIGSWYTELAKDKLGDDLVVAKMPVVPGAIDTNDYHGGAINGWIISADTEYPELCTEIAAWLAYKLSCYIPERAAFEVEESDRRAELTEASKEVLALYEDKEKGGAAWDTMLKTEDTNVWLEMCAELFDKNVNGQEFAQSLGEQLW